MSVEGTSISAITGTGTHMQTAQFQAQSTLVPISSREAKPNNKWRRQTRLTDAKANGGDGGTDKHTHKQTEDK